MNWGFPRIGLSKNVVPDLYEVEANGIHYAMPYDLMVELKTSKVEVGEWYKRLY